MTKKTRAELIAELDTMGERLHQVRVERDRANQDLKIAVLYKKDLEDAQRRICNADLAIGMVLRILFDYDGDWDAMGNKIQHSEPVRALLEIKKQLGYVNTPF